MDRAHFLPGGSQWLNLVNTRYKQNKQIHDLLSDPLLAQQWLETNELLLASAPLAPETLGQLLKKLTAFRDYCGELLSLLDSGSFHPKKVIAELQARIKQCSLKASVEISGEKLILTHKGTNVVDHAIYRTVCSIIDTLNLYALDRIRKCEHEECILYFVDTSKSGKRRWCSMEICGNRNKAAEFYAKKKLK